MIRERLYLAILWIIAVVAVSTPWVTYGGRVFTGWYYLYPHGIMYLIGLIMGLMVLITKAGGFFLSLIAGIFLMMGTSEGFQCVMAMIRTGWSVGTTGGYSIRMGFAFIWSVVYTVVAPFLSTRMSWR